MRRREFIGLLGGGVAGWPLLAQAQPTNVPVVGFLHAGLPGPNEKNVAAFRKGLSEAGYVEGRTVTIEYRWAEGRYELLPAMAADLVDRKVTAIAVAPTSAAVAIRAATTTIPIVFEGGSDPVELGLVASLNRPGGNITGICNSSNGLTAKRLELMHEIVPKAARVTVLVNPSNPMIVESSKRDALAAGATLGLQVNFVEASTVSEIDLAFAQQIDALVVSGDQYFVSLRNQIASLATRYAVPAIHEHPEFAEVGGLMSYGADLENAYRLTGGYVARVLKGEKPGDLPVQMAVTVKLVINLKTAKKFGLSIPASILALASEVIE
jgi:putative ABC transport system substrate-binding protein